MMPVRSISALLLFSVFCLTACQDGGFNPPEHPTCDQVDCVLRIEPADIVLGMGEEASQALWAVYLPSGADHMEYLDREVAWTIEDTSIASVDASGTVQPLSPGQTWISAQYGGEQIWAPVTVGGAVFRHAVMHGGTEREYLLYLPDAVNQGDPLPVVMGFHGGGGNAAHQMRTAQLNRLALESGFMAVYPEGTAAIGNIRTWNGGNCCGNAVQNQIDDVGFVRSVLADLQSRYPVDSARVFATGLSNGAMMTHRLACEAADIFAAVAPVAGGINLGGDFPDCQPSRPVPILMFHGTTDQNYPIDGGDGSGEVGVPDEFFPVTRTSNPNTLDDWRALNAATGAGVVSYRKGDAQCDRYVGNAAVVMCITDPAVPLEDGGVVYDGGGHSWPGGVKSPRAESDVPGLDIDASEFMWDFFRQHARLTVTQTRH